jgi:hypothetical protein
MKNTRFPTEGKKAINCYFAGSTRRPAFPRCREAQNVILCLPAESLVSLVQELESQLLHCYSSGARRPATHNVQRPRNPHCNCGRTPAPPSKKVGTLDPLLKAEKR